MALLAVEIVVRLCCTIQIGNYTSCVLTQCHFFGATTIYKKRSIMKKSILLTAFLVIATALPAMASYTHQKDADTCDRVAASPIDILKPSNVVGVPFKDVDKWKANGSCRRAISGAPPSILPRMEFQAGRALEKMENEYAAEDEYIKAANHHYLAAYVALGWMCYAGLGRERQNFENAFKWYKKGAESGDPTSMNNVGVLYLYGVGVAKDTSKANYWLKRAHEKGVGRTDREPKRITSRGRSIQDPSLSEAKRYVKGLIFDKINNNKEDGVIVRSSIKVGDMHCNRTTYTNTNPWSPRMPPAPTYQCRAVGHALAYFYIHREGEGVSVNQGNEGNQGRKVNEEVRQYAIKLLQNDASYAWGRKRYKADVDAIGEAKVLELAEKVQKAPKRENYYIANYKALGCGEADPRFCFKALLSIAYVDKYKTKCENGDQTACNKLQSMESYYNRGCEEARYGPHHASCVVLQEIRKTKGLKFSQQSQSPSPRQKRYMK